MADANLEVTLDGMQTAIADAVRAAFPAYRTVEFDRDDESEGFPTPAWIASFVEAEPAPADDPGTGQWPALARFEARVILSARKGNAKLEVRKAATAFAAWLNLRRFPGVMADPCQVIACEPDAFAPHLDRFEVWRVEWVIPCFFGESVWKPGPEITEAWYSFAPDIGEAHVDDYTKIEPRVEVQP